MPKFCDELTKSVCCEYPVVLSLLVQISTRIHSVWEASQSTRHSGLTFQLLPGVTGHLHVRNSIKSRYIGLRLRWTHWLAVRSNGAGYRVVGKCCRLIRNTTITSIRAVQHYILFRVRFPALPDFL
jgi:hypothetical protein